MKQKKFSEFFQSRLAEMSMGQSTNQSYKLPESATWLISFMPDPNAQKLSLMWLMGKGLFEAAENRHKLAQIATQELGRHVYDHEIFSEKAHKAIPELGKLYEQKLKPMWDQQLEPKQIGFRRGTKERFIDIPSLNKFIEQQGLPPFSFGGTNGLLEWLEDGAGKWAQRFSSGSPFASGEHHERDGLDLSNPEFIKDAATGSHYYRFGSNPDINMKFMPPHNEAGADEHLRTMDMISGDKIKEALDGGQSSLSPQTLSWLQRRKPDLIQDTEIGLGTRTKSVAGNDDGKEIKIDDDEWDMVVDYIKRGMEQISNNKKAKLGKIGNNDKDSGLTPAIKAQRAELSSAPWTPEDIHTMMWGNKFEVPVKVNGNPTTKIATINGLLDPEKRTIRAAVEDPLAMRVVYNQAFELGKTPESRGWNTRNRKNSKIFMDAGLATAKPGEPKPDKTVTRFSYTLPHVPTNQYVTTPNYSDDKKSIKIDDLLNQGYKFRDSSDKAEMDSGKLTSITLEKGPQEYVIADKGPNDQWFIRDIASYSPEKKAAWKNSPLIVHGGSFGSHANFSAPVDELVAARMKKNWYGNPEKYGDSIGKGGILESIHAAIAAARSQFNKRTQNTDFLKTKNNEEFVSAGYTTAASIFGTWAFKYGDPKGMWDVREKNVDPNYKRSLPAMLAEIGVDKEQGDKYVEELYNSANERRAPDFPPQVEQVFLKNGFNWRVTKISNGIFKEMMADYENSKQNKSGMTVAGKDGDQKDISGDIANHQKIVGMNSDDGMKTGKVSKIGGVSNVVSTGSHDVVKLASEDTAKNAFEKYAIASDAKIPDEAQKIANKPEYRSNYWSTSSQLDFQAQLNPMVEPEKLVDNVQKYLTDINKSLLVKLGSAKSPSVGRAAIDAVGDLLGSKLIELMKKPAMDRFDKTLLASTVERFFSPGPSSLIELAKKYNLGDVSAPVATIVSSLRSMNPKIMTQVDDVMDQMKLRRTEYENKTTAPAIPTAGTEATPNYTKGYSYDPGEATPNYTKGYSYDPDEQKPAMPDIAKPTPAPGAVPFSSGPAPESVPVNRPYEYHRRPRAAMTQQPPTRKAESFETFREWKNWNIIKRLKTGLK